MSAVRFLILAVSFVSVSLAVPLEEYELQFVTFVHRHGDRSPVGTYPTDPYGNESLWNNGWGELTNKGKQSAYGLGVWLRTRYSDFLPRVYRKNDYEVQSTDVRRTLMSAYLVLAGLYKPVGSDVWNAEIDWQPIPVHTTPGSMDNVLAASKPCPKHSQLLLQLFKSKEITDLLDSMSPALAEIAQHSGFNSTSPLLDFYIASSVYDSLNVQSMTGLKLPKWTESYFPQPLQKIGSLMLRFPTYNRPLQRLSCGLLVENILKNLKLKSTGELKIKMWQYSAHDITIVGLSQCLSLANVDLPPYASALILELRSKKDRHYVRVLYKNNENLQTLVLPGCEENCPLEKFEQLVKPIIPEDWEAECQLKKN